MVLGSFHYQCGHFSFDYLYCDCVPCVDQWRAQISTSGSSWSGLLAGPWSGAVDPGQMFGTLFGLRGPGFWVKMTNAVSGFPRQAKHPGDAWPAQQVWIPHHHSVHYTPN